jgi:hypothetical protein
MEKYFVIHNGDGDTTVREYTKEELISDIVEGAWGDAVVLENIPSDDTNYWGGDILIIKGEIVTPKEKKVVVEYELK